MSNGNESGSLIDINELAILVAEEIHKLENENKNKNKNKSEAEAESEVETGDVETGDVEGEMEGEVEGEQKLRVHVYNGNSYMKHSGNAKAFAKQEQELEED